MSTLVRMLPRAVVCSAILLAAAPGAAGSSGADAPPGPGPGTYTITPPADSIRIPFEAFRGDIRLTGRVNGREARMLVDNGALWDDLLFFGSPRVDALGLKREGEILVGGAGSGDPIRADMVPGMTLLFDGEDGRVIEFQDQTGIIMPYDPEQPNPWEGSEGQVSSAFFKHFVVTFDFDNLVMTLTRPEAFDPEGKGTPIPITPTDDGSWTIPGALTLHDGRRLELHMTMDLGWDEPVALNTGQTHKIKVPEGLEKIDLGFGAQGKIRGWYGTVAGLEIGGISFRNPIATYSTIEDGGAKVDEVLVGYGIFERLHVIFDYPGHRLFVRPNKAFQRPFVGRPPGSTGS